MDRAKYFESSIGYHSTESTSVRGGFSEQHSLPLGTLMVMNLDRKAFGDWRTSE